ncbi:MAG: DASS family sodium-coupled anion symporter [Polyangiaceae bacterium]
MSEPAEPASTHPASPSGAAPPPDGGAPAPPKEETSPVVRAIGISLGLIAFLVLAFAPTGLERIEGYGRRPAFAAGVAALMAIWWLFEAIPIAVTACIPLVAFPALGVYGKGLGGDVRRTVEPFFDAYIFLFLGGMTIGAAMEHFNLHRRVALHIMRAIGTDPKRLLLGMIVATASISLWISNTATAVMMLPIALALLAQLETQNGGRRLKHFGAAVMLSVAYASNVGGIGTKIGTGTNSIFCGFVAEKLHYDIGFLQYIAIGLPFVAIFLPIIWLWLWRYARHDRFDFRGGREALGEQLAAMGPLSGAERRVASVFATAALLWILGDLIRGLIAPAVAALLPGFKMAGKHYEAAVAMLAALSLMAARVLPLAAWKRIPYGTLVLLGGSFAMAAGIEGSGLGKWMASELAVVATLPLWLQISAAAAATVALSAVASNTATVNVALNVLPAALPVLSATAIAASCDFMLPAGTPPNAIVFGSGYIRLPVMIRIGFALDVVAVLLVSVYARFYLVHLLP